MGKGKYVLACLAAALAVAGGTAGAASAETTLTLSPGLQALALRNLDSCAANPFCVLFVKRAVTACKADPTCGAAYAELLASGDPIIAKIDAIANS